MKIYDAFTQEELQSFDLSAGYLVDGEIVTGYTIETIPGTVTDTRPNGLRREVPLTEPCQFYYPNHEGTSTKSVDQKISDAVTAAVALAQGGM